MQTDTYLTPPFTSDHMTEKTESPLTDDLRIGAMKTLMPPRELMAEIPATPDVAETVARARKGIQRVLSEDDDRLVVVVGPCSIHDPDAAMEYARMLAAEQQKLPGPVADCDASLFRKTSHNGRLERLD